MNRFIFLLVAMLGSLSAHATEYVVHNRMEFLKPVNLAAMNTDFQSATSVEDKGGSVVVDITYRPFRAVPEIQANKNWLKDDRGMTEYLNPGITTNWDSQLRTDLLEELAQAQIDPSNLSDVELVQQVSNWLLKNFSGNAPFVAFYVDFQNGKPVVKDEFRKSVDQQKTQFGLQTDQDVFDRGLLGKGMFYNHMRGSCTSSAILWATVFRALGIPTRIVETTPSVDANDATQMRAIVDDIGNNVVRSTLVEGVGVGAGDWAMHTFVDVYIGGRWVWLNYNRLGQPILDPEYLGLITIVNEMNDWSESGLVDTWGLHAVDVWSGIAYTPALSSVNPYRSLGIYDNMNALDGFPNPPGDLNFPLTATLGHIWIETDPSIPASLLGDRLNGYKTIFATVEEPSTSVHYSWLNFLVGVLHPEFELISDSGQALLVSSDIGEFAINGMGGLALRLSDAEYAKLVPGSTYRIAMLAGNDPEFILKTAPNLEFQAF